MRDETEVTRNCKALEVAQFVAMAIMEGCTVGLTILAKTAMSNGTSPFVFVLYTNALAPLILLPYSFFLRRDRTEEASHHPGSTLASLLLEFNWVGTLTQYPQVMKVVPFYSLVGTLQCAVVSFVVERNLSAWKPKPDLKILLIISTAIFGGVIRPRVQIWCPQAKVPFYVPMFKPFGILYACFFVVSFFANTLYYGS